MGEHVHIDTVNSHKQSHFDVGQESDSDKCMQQETVRSHQVLSYMFNDIFRL